MDDFRFPQLTTWPRPELPPQQLAWHPVMQVANDMPAPPADAPAAPVTAPLAGPLGAPQGVRSGAGSSPIRHDERRHIQALMTGSYPIRSPAEEGLRRVLNTSEQVMNSLQQAIGGSTPLPRAEAGFLLDHALLAFEPFIERLRERPAALTPQLRARAAHLAHQIDQFQAALGRRIAQGGGGTEPLLTSLAPDVDCASRLFAQAATVAPAVSPGPAPAEQSGPLRTLFRWLRP